MNYKLRIFSVVLAATSTISMIAASGAAGSELHLYNTRNITGQQVEQNAFSTDAGVVRCTQSASEGTLIESEEINELTLTGTFTGCEAFGQAATIDMNGCKFTVTGSGQPALTAQVDVTGCTSGKAIEVTTGICRMTIPEQHGLNHITFEDVTGTTHVKAKATVQGISYVSDGPLCPTMPQGQTKQNGQYTGQVTVKAYEDTGSEQVTHNGHQYSKGKCGDQIGLLVT